MTQAYGGSTRSFHMHYNLQCIWKGLLVLLVYYYMHTEARIQMHTRTIHTHIIMYIIYTVNMCTCMKR